MRTQIQSLASLSGLGIQCCHELWRKSQMRHGSCVAVAMASSYSSDWTPSLGIAICRGCGPKEEKKKKKFMLRLYPYLPQRLWFNGSGLRIWVRLNTAQLI